MKTTAASAPAVLAPFTLVALLAARPAPAAQEGGAGRAAQRVPERGLRLRAEDALEGFTLIAPLRSHDTLLLDMQGEVVHRWTSELPPGNSAYLLDDGTLLRCAREPGAPVFEGGGQGGRVQLLAPDGALLWDFDYASEEHLQHHDVAPLPNGNVLLIAWERKTRDEAIAAGRDPAQIGERGLWPDFLVEIEPVRPDGGVVVWEWHAWDHLIQDFDPEKANFGDVAAHPERIDLNADHRDQPPLSAAERRRLRELEQEMRGLGYTGGGGGGDDDEEAENDDDERGGPGRRGQRGRPRGGDWLHTNSVDRDPARDLIVLSLRELSEIWIIDHSTTTAEAAGSTGGRHGHGGDLLFRWGNPRTYGAGAADERRLFVQHDASFVPAGSPGAGHVLVFNNGEGRPGGQYSSVDEIALPYEEGRGFVRAEGAAWPPAAPVWSYVAPQPESLFSAFISGAQRLANGNTLICSGAQGRLLEVRPGGEVVWEYLSTHGGDAADERGGPPGRRGARGGGPPPGAGFPRGERPPRAGGPGGPGGMDRTGLFRATRLTPDHPGLAALLGAKGARDGRRARDGDGR